LLIVSGVVLALIVLSLVDFGAEDVARSADAAAPVVTVRVVRADLRETYSTVGTVAGRSEVTIAAQTEGVLREVAVQPGDRVERGRTLAALDDRALRAELAQAESALDRSTAELERVEQLAESGIAEARRLESATAQHGIDRAAVERLDTQLSQSRFPSPFDGIVTAQHAYPGDTVQSGSPIVSLADVAQLRIIAKVPFTVASRLGPGAVARLEPPDGAELAATVALVHPAADPVSHQTVVELDAGDAFPRLQPGFIVKIALTLAERPRALVLDRRAVPEARAGSEVDLFVVRDGRGERRTVRLGLIVEDGAEVASGLAEGDAVVIRGGAQLTDGAPVRIVGDDRTSATRD
jgi:membrane fusion protein (multidrug efflux system)